MVRAPVSPDGAASRALRSAGLRVTMPRQAMLAWLAEHPHCTTDAIGAGLRERFHSVSAQAVYDVLAACATAGLLRRIEPPGHPARYERRTGDSHHHVVCRRFDRTENPGCVIGAELCLASAGIWVSSWTRPRGCPGACASPAAQLKTPRTERTRTRR